MPDLDDLRARHFASLTDDGDRCRDEGDLWPCDTAIVLAALDAALARERRLREALDDHWPEAGTEPDDTPTLSCSCGWDSEPWRKGSLNWPEHIRAALAETPEAGS